MKKKTQAKAKTGEKLVVAELRKRENGTVYGLGNIYELPTEEAEPLIAAGTHKLMDIVDGEDLKDEELPTVAAVDEDEGKVKDGDDNDS